MPRARRREARPLLSWTLRAFATRDGSHDEGPHEKGPLEEGPLEEGPIDEDTKFAGRRSGTPPRRPHRAATGERVLAPSDRRAPSRGSRARRNRHRGGILRERPGVAIRSLAS